MDYEYPVTVIRVKDGDSLILKIDLGFKTFVEKDIRLFGIDAPEKRGKTKDAGIAAKKHLAYLLKKHAPITIKTLKDKTGKYGRYLGILYGCVDKKKNQFICINNSMVEDNHAVMRDY